MVLKLHCYYAFDHLTKEGKVADWTVVLQYFMVETDFFNKGVTRPCLKVAGNSPTSSDQFIIEVIQGSNTSIPFFSKLVGSGSSEQDLEGAAMMDCFTSCSETALNFDKVEEGCS